MYFSVETLIVDHFVFVQTGFAEPEKQYCIQPEDDCIVPKHVADCHLYIKLCLDFIYILFIHIIVCRQLLLGFVVCSNNNNNNNRSRATINITVNMNS